LVYLYFVDKPKVGKVRPVLVLECGKNHLIVAKITTHDLRNNISDYALDDWEAAGLTAPSTVRCAPVFEIGHGELLRNHPVGSLAQTDRENVAEIIDSLGLFDEQG
jgi:hypothetical protein